MLGGRGEQGKLMNSQRPLINSQRPSHVHDLEKRLERMGVIRLKQSSSDIYTRQKEQEHEGRIHGRGQKFSF